MGVMEEAKQNNDPWVPLPDETSQAVNPTIIAAPQNLPHNMIDSERYIQTLENKLAQLTKKKCQEPTSKDIITALALFHDDQMKRYVADTDVSDLNITVTSDEPISSASFVQRKLHPERQPLSAEELAELIREDVMAKTFEEMMENEVKVLSKTKQNEPQDSSSQFPLSNATVGHTDLSCIGNSNASLVRDTGGLNSEPVTESSEENWANFDEMN